MAVTRVVLDTNVLLAAFFTRGLCETLLDVLIERNDVRLVVSEFILDEFAEHAVGKFRAAKNEVGHAIRFIRAHAEVVTPAAVPSDACRDPDDVQVLGTAIAGEAVAVVTGDRDLLALRMFQGVALLSPREFYDRLH